MIEVTLEQERTGKLLYEEFAYLLKDNYEKKEGRRAWRLFYKRFPDGIKINQYNKFDALCNTFSTFSEIIDCSNYKNFYYRYDAFPKTYQQRINITHFGIRIRPIGSAKLTEGIYCNTCLNSIIQLRAFSSFCGKRYFDPFILPVYYRFASKMDQIAHLDSAEFNTTVDKLVEFWQLQYVLDLSGLSKCCGIYVMVLDEYKQCYIGKSNDIRTRITQHWSRDDTISGYGVDTFRAQDTTRIFILPMEKKAFNKHVDTIEYMMIDSIDEKYLLNIMPGGDLIGNIHDPNSQYI